MRPWSIWWDFIWEGDHNTHVTIETDHPKYKREIMRFPIKDCQNNLGTIDDWERNWFIPFVDDIKSGRKSIHTIMKELKKNEK